MADEDAADAAEGGESTRHGVVVADMPVAMQFDEFIAAEASNIIEHEWPGAATRAICTRCHALRLR